MGTDSGDVAEEETSDAADEGDVAAEMEVSSDDRTWGILVHASGFVGLVLPLGNIVAPLLIWLIKKDDSPFVEENGKRAVNFQISWTIYMVIAALTILVFIGFILLPLIALAWAVLIILASVRASNEQIYDYPLTISFFS